MAAIIAFNKPDRVIEVDSDVHPVAVTVQELVDAIRDYESELVNMEISPLASVTGKTHLGGGLYTGITLVLQGWTVKFPDHPGPDVVWAGVVGGNLLAVDVNGGAAQAFTPSTYTSILYGSSTAAALLDPSAQNPWALSKTDNQEAGTMGGRVKDLEDMLSRVRRDTTLIPALL